MKIKHWAGYGCVDVKVVGKGKNYKAVEITGNHEWGLDRHDEYCIGNWLKRFIPKGMAFDDYSVLSNGYKEINGLDTEYIRIGLFFKEA